MRIADRGGNEQAALGNLGRGQSQVLLHRLQRFFGVLKFALRVGCLLAGPSRVVFRVPASNFSFLVLRGAGIVLLFQLFVSASDKSFALRNQGHQVVLSHKKAEEIGSTRKNEKHGQSKIERLVVSSSGDLAYEYGSSTIEFDDTQSGKHESFSPTYLRVWKRDGSVWKVAAAFFRPNPSKICPAE